MINFIIYLLCSILFFTLYSFRDYSKYYKVYQNLIRMQFNKNLNLLIANENTNQEFVIISDWNYVISPKCYVQFDIWSLVNLHQLYWLVKFHLKLKNLGILNNLK
jgi:hypothetical protein